ncbi:MAG: hypothetical protein VX730_00810 [Pseudomonadota bacterium]|nr:hypothetical protein [Pseudomonadota bacterium]
MNKCIGLFGSCGASRWREPFVKVYKEKNVSFYNPYKEEWKPEYVTEEAEHLASDAIILFPITRESYALGSLAEIGFALLNLQKNPQKHLIIFIDDKLSDALLENETLAGESLRTRALVKAHLKQQMYLECLHLVDSLEDMLSLSLKLYNT